MAEKFNQLHPNLPKNQPFNVGARHGVKINSWWNPSSKTYWKNKNKSK